MHIYIYIHIQHIHIYTHIYIYISLYPIKHIYLSLLYLYIRIYIYIYTYVCIYIYMCNIHIIQTTIFIGYINHHVWWSSNHSSPVLIFTSHNAIIPNFCWFNPHIFFFNPQSDPMVTRWISSFQTLGSRTNLCCRCCNRIAVIFRMGSTGNQLYSFCDFGSKEELLNIWTRREFCLIILRSFWDLALRVKWLQPGVVVQVRLAFFQKKLFSNAVWNSWPQY